MHPNGNSSGQVDKEKMGAQPVKEPSMGNLGSKVQGSHLAAATNSQGQDVK